MPTASATRYYVMYIARATLLEAGSGRVMGQATCPFPQPVIDESPTYDEMLANDGALLRTHVQQDQDRCLKALRQDMLAR